MFRRSPLHQLRQLRHLAHLPGRVAGPGLAAAIAVADGLHWHALGKRAGSRARRVPRARRPSFVTLLIAGAAVLALMKLVTARRDNRSFARNIMLGGLIIAIGIVVLSLRRRSRRYSW